MTPAIHRGCSVLEWCGAALVVLVSFPVIALGLFVLRALLLAVSGALILAAVLLYCAHPPFRRWVAAHTHDPRPTRLIT